MKSHQLQRRRPPTTLQGRTQPMDQSRLKPQNFRHCIPSSHHPNVRRTICSSREVQVGRSSHQKFTHPLKTSADFNEHTALGFRAPNFKLNGEGIVYASCRPTLITGRLSRSSESAKIWLDGLAQDGHLDIIAYKVFFRTPPFKASDIGVF